MKINKIRGDSTDISAKKEALAPARHMLARACAGTSLCIRRSQLHLHFARSRTNALTHADGLNGLFLDPQGWQVQASTTAGPLIIRSLLAEKRVSTGALGALDDLPVVQTKIWKRSWLLWMWLSTKFKNLVLRYVVEWLKSWHMQGSKQESVVMVSVAVLLPKCHLGHPDNC